MTDDELAHGIERFIAHATGATAVRVTDLRRLTGGASRETWSLDAAIERDGGSIETLPLILQRDVRGAPKELTRPMEFQLMKAAFDEGVPAPEPLWVGDDLIGAGESFFVRRVDGETLPRRLLREDIYAPARAALPEQLGRLLAQIHAIPVEKHALTQLPAPPVGVSPAAFEVDRYEQIFRMIAPEPHPVFELAFRWLRKHPVIAAPSATPRTLVHGDFRIGNVLFGPEGLRVMLDWELAHIGDPMEDMGFICVRSWRFGGPQPGRGCGAGGGRGAGGRGGGGGAVLRGIRIGGRREGRPGARAVLGGVRQPALGRHLPEPGAHLPRRHLEERRAGQHRPPHGGDGVGVAGVD